MSTRAVDLPIAGTHTATNGRFGRGTAVVVMPRPRTIPASASQRLRRLLNLLVAGLGLVVLAPVMLVVAILVKLTSRGPILFVQTRIGLDRRRPSLDGTTGRRRTDSGGKPFRMYKFRTMYVGHGEAQVWARPDDPRVTPVGKILRRYRLDELPQLWNVVRGEMNIVGPRPEQPQIFLQLRERIDRYELRQRVPPGITGWAQINQRYDQTVEDVRNKLCFDLEYIHRCSPAEDLRIMAMTLPVMFTGRGAW